MFHFIKHMRYWVLEMEGVHTVEMGLKSNEVFSDEQEFHLCTTHVCHL